MTRPRSPSTDAELINRLIREDFLYFIKRVFTTLHPAERYEDNWHISALAWMLEQARCGVLKRQLITMPPRHMKSLCCSVAWAAYLLGKTTGVRIMLISYGLELSQANLRKLREVMQSHWYESAFPHVRVRGGDQNKLLVSGGAEVRALSTGGVITGFGADYIIFDDPMKQSDAVSAVERSKVLNFYQGTIQSRTNDPRTGRIIVVMQRVHADDLAGHLAAQPNVAVLNLSSIANETSRHNLLHGRAHERRPGDLLWPDRFTREVLDQKRLEMGEYEFALQFQQSPIPSGGGLIRVDEIHRHTTAPERNRCQQLVFSIDSAFSDQAGADYSAIGVFGYHEDAWRLLHVYRDRLRYPDLLDRIRALRAQWRPDIILIERASSGIPLIDDLVTEHSRARRQEYPTWRVQPYVPRVGKEERSAAQTARLRQGRLTLPEDAPWLSALLSEIEAFPNGSHDDQVDMISQFLDWTGRVRDPSEWGQRPLRVDRPLGRPRTRARAAN